MPPLVSVEGELLSMDMRGSKLRKLEGFALLVDGLVDSNLQCSELITL
jgi:hypothetical protein